MNLLTRMWYKIDIWLTQVVITKIYGCKDLSMWRCEWCGAKWKERCKKGCI